MTSFGSNLNQELGAKRATTTTRHQVYHLMYLREVVLIQVCFVFHSLHHYIIQVVQ